MLREPGGEAKEELRVSRMASVQWSADGKTIYGTDQHIRPAAKGGLIEEGRKWWRYEVATGKVTELDIPEKYSIWQETPDGKGLLCLQTTGEQEVKPRVLIPKVATVVTPTGKFEPKVLIPEEVNVAPMAAFPDGKRWVVISIEFGKRKVGVYTQGDKKPVWWGTEVSLSQFAVSPDGKRVAYSNYVSQRLAGGRETEVYDLCVADADGKNVKKILTTGKYITHIDWR
jgi:dipeptidyl aminopeptidase/acylaminoacyl peptidase